MISSLDLLLRVLALEVLDGARIAGLAPHVRIVHILSASSMSLIAEEQSSLIIQTSGNPSCSQALESRRYRSSCTAARITMKRSANRIVHKPTAIRRAVRVTETAMPDREMLPVINGQHFKMRTYVATA